MTSRRLVFFYFALLFSLQQSSGYEQDSCKELPGIKTIPATTPEWEVSVKLSLDALKKFFKSSPLDGSITFAYKSKSETILKGQSSAVQGVVKLVALKMFCEELSTSALPSSEKIKLIDAFVHDRSVDLPKPLIPPAVQSATEIREPARKVLRREADFEVIEAPGGRDGWAIKYLQPAPSVRDAENSWFAIVASPNTRDEGEAGISSLRERFPDYEFALFSPYGANTHWAIMMASWVSKATAREALKIAREKVDKGSYPWHF